MQYFAQDFIDFFDELKRNNNSVREYISSNLKDFENLINDKAFKKYFGKVEGKKNKRLPIEFRQILEKQPLIANKQFYYIGKVDIKKILSKNLTGHLMKYYYAAKPMNQFLSNALH
jgi:hypothetical protein